MPNIIMADPKGAPVFRKIAEQVLESEKIATFAIPSKIADTCRSYIIFCDLTLSEASKPLVYLNSNSSANNRLAQATSNVNAFNGACFISVFPSESNGDISTPKTAAGTLSIGSSNLRILNATIGSFIFATSTNASLSGKVELWGWV